MAEILSSEWAEWNSHQYLKDYYTVVEPDEVETIKFLVDRFRHIRGQPLMLEFGCGPTLHHVFPAVSAVSEIHMVDYLESNLREIQAWKMEEKRRHSWRDFVRYTLQCEGVVDPTEEEIMGRKRLAREKISRLALADAASKDPMGKNHRGYYPLVVSCYCADSATDDKDTWREYMRHIASLIAPKGIFITTALRQARYYRVGDKSFPSANINEEDMEQVLGLDFYPESISIEVKGLPWHEWQGYSGVILAHAIKKE